jgi:hypothetical protein
MHWTDGVELTGPRVVELAPRDGLARAHEAAGDQHVAVPEPHRDRVGAHVGHGCDRFDPAPAAQPRRCQGGSRGGDSHNAPREELEWGGPAGARGGPEQGFDPACELGLAAKGCKRERRDQPSALRCTPERAGRGRTAAPRGRGPLVTGPLALKRHAPPGEGQGGIEPEDPLDAPGQNIDPLVAARQMSGLVRQHESQIALRGRLQKSRRQRYDRVPESKDGRRDESVALG